MTNRQDYTVIEIIEKILKRVISNYSTFLGETNLNVNTIKISVERSRNLVFGDYSTNFLLTIDAQPNKIEQYAHYIINKLSNYRNFFSVVTFTKPGFINFFISTKWLLKNMKQILTMKKSYGRFNKKKLFYNIEFVSANPTGLLHIGHARNAAYGDALVNIWKTYGIKVNREYYINDAGNQIDKLALSVLIRYLQENNKVVKIPKDGYNGDEIVTIAKEVNKIYGTKYLNTVYDDEKITDPETNNFFRVFAVGNMLNMIRKSLASFSVKFDIFTSESSIYKTNLIDQVLYDLREYTYQKDGATFLKTTQFSDEKDRVLIKTDGTYTYFLPDIAYHKIKLLRNYDMIFNIWGADHKSYIERMSIAMQMLGFAKEKMHVFVQQMVHLTKNGKEFKMSKRSGDSITIDFLLDTIGKDAARWFLVATSFESSHLDIDVDKVLNKNSSNPLFYVQYAHSRIVSLIKKYNEINNVGFFTKFKNKFKTEYRVNQIKTNEERLLMNMLLYYRSLIQFCATKYQVNAITTYLYNLASSFHNYYETTKIVDDQNQKTRAISAQRILLCKAIKQVLANGLVLLGITPTKKMEHQQEKQ